MNRRTFCGTDLIVIFGILLLSLILGTVMYSSNPVSTAEIYKDNILIATVSLNKDDEFTLSGARGFIFEIKNNSICIKSSPCENKVCINTGYISKGNEAIVCLPERLCVKAVSDDVYDAVVG